MNLRNQKKLERLGVVVSNKPKVPKDVCEDCGEVLPKPKWEQREGGYSEQVITCKCGAVYTD